MFLSFSLPSHPERCLGDLGGSAGCAPGARKIRLLYYVSDTEGAAANDRPRCKCRSAASCFGMEIAQSDEHVFGFTLHLPAKAHSMPPPSCFSHDFQGVHTPLRSG